MEPPGLIPVAHSPGVGPGRVRQGREQTGEPEQTDPDQDQRGGASIALGIETVSHHDALA